METQVIGYGMQRVEDRAPAAQADLPEPVRLRVHELETENARLKSLVGELLVANQLLREGSTVKKSRDSGPTP
jgi:hypothetical protein